MKVIRKISVGIDYPNGVMHYQVGKQIKVLDEVYEISSILIEAWTESKVAYNIYISNTNNSLLWKSIVDMPVHIEYDVTFS